VLTDQETFPVSPRLNGPRLRSRAVLRASTGDDRHPTRRRTVTDALAVPLGLLATAGLRTLTVWGGLVVAHDDVLVHDLRARGVTTRGVVTSVVETYSARSGVGYRRDVSYLGGHTIHDSGRCRCDAVGDHVAVVYDPDRPERAMTTKRLDGWSRLDYLPVAVLAVLSALTVIVWVSLAAKLTAWKVRVLRHGDPRAHSRERARVARDYIAFVNSHQRSPALTGGEPDEQGLASWWVTVQTVAPHSREVRLVIDVLTVTGL
jgi:hypothetical protein